MEQGDKKDTSASSPNLSQEAHSVKLVFRDPVRGIHDVAVGLDLCQPRLFECRGRPARLYAVPETRTQALRSNRFLGGHYRHGLH